MNVQTICFQDLGRDLLYFILLKLDIRDLISIRRLNSFFFKLLQNTSFWKAIFLRDFPLDKEQLKLLECETKWIPIYSLYWRIQMVHRTELYLRTNDLFTLTKVASNTWTSSISRRGFGVGRHYWEVKVNQLDPMNRSIIIGVTTKTECSLTGLYQGSFAWGYYSFTGECYNQYKASRYSQGYTTGDVIGVYLEVDENLTAHLAFFKNSVFCGFIPYTLTGENYYPFIDLYREGNSVTMIPYSSNTNKVLKSTFYSKKARNQFLNNNKSIECSL